MEEKTAITNGFVSVTVGKKLFATNTTSREGRAHLVGALEVIMLKR